MALSIYKTLHRQISIILAKSPREWEVQRTVWNSKKEQWDNDVRSWINEDWEVELDFFHMWSDTLADLQRRQEEVKSKVQGEVERVRRQQTDETV